MQNCLKSTLTFKIWHLCLAKFSGAQTLSWQPMSWLCLLKTFTAHYENVIMSNYVVQVPVALFMPLQK